METEEKELRGIFEIDGDEYNLLMYGGNKIIFLHDVFDNAHLKYVDLVSNENAFILIRHWENEAEEIWDQFFEGDSNVL